MNIVPFQPEHAEQAADLFVAGFRRLRQGLPLLSARLEDPTLAAQKIGQLMETCSGYVALDDGGVAGYLGGWIVDGFRDTRRRGTYTPEWGHAARAGGKTQIYRALYRCAAQDWFAAGCGVHALTLLAGDDEAQKAWFWNGYGLAVVDGIRATEALGARLSPGYEFRKATPADAEKLADLEAEHWRHYPQPPTLMVTCWAQSPAELAAFIARPDACAWVAWQGEEMVGYMRFEDHIDGAAEMVSGPGITGITGAYVRPAHRGRGLAPALLDCGLKGFAAQGYHACAVDFESFNPEAATFWPKYFDLAALSVMRIPEREP